jgi:uncharacterized protein (TIGR02452 family)
MAIPLIGRITLEQILNVGIEIDEFSKKLDEYNKKQLKTEEDIINLNKQFCVLDSQVKKCEEIIKKVLSHSKSHPDINNEKCLKRCSYISEQMAMLKKQHNIPEIHQMIEHFKNNQDAEAVKIFDALPHNIQDAIKGKHWKICGGPTPESENESLKKMAHDDFGGVSFRGTEPRCSVSKEKKIETLEAYLQDLCPESKQSINQSTQTANKAAFIKQEVLEKVLDTAMALDALSLKIGDYNTDQFDEEIQKVTEDVGKVLFFDTVLDNVLNSKGEQYVKQCKFIYIKSDALKQKHSLISPALKGTSSNDPSCQINIAPINLAPQPFKEYPILSFSISTLPLSFIPAPTSITEQLNRIASLFRQGKDAEALKEIKELPGANQNNINFALWLVCGKPSGHANFGEYALYNKGEGCVASLDQKAAAIEFCKTKATIYEMMYHFGKGEEAKAIELFKTLPKEIQEKIYEKHWEVCGKPTPQSEDPALKAMAHDNFGKVSFFGEEARCAVSADKKIETLKAYLPGLYDKMNECQLLIPQVKDDWKKIDTSTTIKGQDKNTEKQKSLKQFANTLASTLLGTPTVLAVPPSTGTSHVALIAAYVEKYPFLRPFLSQLHDKFEFPEDKLGQAAPSIKSSREQTPCPINTDLRDYRIKIMNETLGTLTQGSYVNAKGETVQFNLQPSTNSLECFSGKNIPSNIKRQGSYQTKLFLDNKDCLVVTQDCAQRKLNPLVLDAASENKFGGGYKTGAGAQEENMCRRSGLCIAVDPSQNAQKNDFYTLTKNGEHAGLYVANVPVFRGEEKDGYPYLEEPFEAAVGIVAAYNLNVEYQQRLLSRKTSTQPVLAAEKDLATGELRLPQLLAEGTKCKLRTLLDMAVAKGHESIVLVALGCGAFHNPPGHVCELMMELITEEFPHSFREIHISIIDDHNTGKAHNAQGNFAPFKNIIEQKFQGKLQSENISFQIT